MNQNQALTKLSLKFALEQGIRTCQSITSITSEDKSNKLRLTQEFLKDAIVLSNVKLEITDHPYKFKIKGRKSPHSLENIRFGLNIELDKEYNILVTKCENGILKLLTHEHS